MINPNPRRSDEPIWWSLFGAGGTWFAMITPVTILVLGILMPLDVFDVGSFNFLRAHAFATSIIGALFIIASIALPMWHAMHRVHHGMHDLKFHTGIVGKVACYAVAGIVTVLAIAYIFLL